MLRGFKARVLEKILTSLLLALALITAMFFLLRTSSRDPSLTLLGKSARPRSAAELRLRLGLEDSTLRQLGRAVSSGLRLDFGNSLVTHEPVARMIGRSLGPTACLMIPAYGLAILTAFFLAGASHLAELGKRRSVGRWGGALATITTSISLLFYTVLGQYFFGYILGWFPISGWDSGLTSRFRFTALPSLIFALACVGTHFIFFRRTLLNQAKQGYVLMARAKGLSEAEILRRHVLRNGIFLFGTLIALEFPFLFLGSFLIESYFGIPGMGSLMVDAIRDSDIPVIYGTTLFIGLMGIVFSLGAELFCVWIDPRVEA